MSKIGEIGIYIHIPFCKKKCIYCDFLSFSENENQIERYINAIIKEIKQWVVKNKNKNITTIYIGGGTPSYINSNYIEKILKTITSEVHSIEEITIEVNPGTVTQEKLKKYKQLGINRLSIGLQSTENKILKNIGRIHTFEDFLDTYSTARNLGFENINTDLIIGFPGQTIENIEKTLDKLLNLKPVPEHISVYSLIVEEETPLEEMIKNNLVQLPDEDIERKMYWYTKKRLEKNEYIHYEISNFSKNGFESKHNLNCWEQKEYIGFGLGASSYINKIRFSNIINIKKYIENIENGQLEKNIIIQEKQEKEEQMKEYMLLGLRKIKGIDILDFQNKFKQNPVKIFKKELDKLTNEELITTNENFIKLTEKGLDLANIVWEEFI